MRLGIRWRLYAGFGFLVLLTAALGVFSARQQRLTIDSYETREGLEARTRRASNATALAARLTEQSEVYRATWSPEMITRMEESRGALEELSLRMVDQALTAERRQIYLRINGNARQLRTQIDRLAEAGRTILREKDRLLKGGDELTRLTGVLTAEIWERDSAAQVAQVGAVEAAVLLTQVANWRFLATLDPNGAITFRTHAGKTRDALELLRRTDSKSVSAAAIRAVEGALAAYAAAFGSTFAAMAEARTAYESGIKPAVAAISEDASHVQGKLQEVVTTSRAEAAAAVEAARLTQLVLVGLVLVLGAALAVLIARSIVRPIIGMTETMRRLAEGDMGVEVPAQGTSDEMGRMAAAVEVFRRNALDRIALEAAQAEAQSARQRRADRVDALVRGFQQRIAGALEIVTSAATELDATARGMTRVADGTNQQAAASSTAAEQTAANVRMVATAAEEMVASLQEVERQVLRSSEVATLATREAEATNASMASLSEAAERIGAAVAMISSIASQTNLLALNATIEAARAGEAGRGFAVVAAEVKELAGQTARATDEIGGQIAAIQAATQQAAAAIRQIGATIASINEITGTIASTVVEQTAATNEISRNAGEAARGTQDVSASATRVLSAASETGGAASQVLAAAAELASQSLTVKREVDDFLDAIQAA
ncbi:methyl-accepting chemotaxis sensory transducer [Methylobacterium sp. 4-46]|uniref:methyl-accepting chemotaxis protein n=1 Tax=unclassified Methylobacterium TaxID=2615210 RepID=UPI000152CCA9|nr:MULTISPECIES: HAMP domain-containing methyl-accepting chemotaxis protein [Methylobacterium]ACA15196.1 methyl-accepting chemotaxis sensory transducer [Methylobacterium sp. 4-46]WFT80927.1 HAMP domain-containing methyl-accepting chemotaxis protein [Methylobacterium nodulans]